MKSNGRSTREMRGRWGGPLRLHLQVRISFRPNAKCVRTATRLSSMARSLSAAQRQSWDCCEWPSPRSLSRSNPLGGVSRRSSSTYTANGRLNRVTAIRSSRGTGGAARCPLAARGETFTIITSSFALAAATTRATTESRSAPGTTSTAYIPAPYALAAKHPTKSLGRSASGPVARPSFAFAESATPRHSGSGGGAPHPSIASTARDLRGITPVRAHVIVPP